MKCEREIKSMTSRYKITPESRIALYGYNIYTRKQIQWLTSWGCTEIYVIDRNADKIGKIEGAEIVPDIGQINGSAESSALCGVNNFIHRHNKTLSFSKRYTSHCSASKAYPAAAGPFG